MAALEKNNIYTARIEGYSSEGLGIARIDGQVVFVHGAVRGELCRVLVMKVLKNAAFGKVTELLEPSPERREPDCPYYGRCGGCDFRHLSYREELWAKRQRVQDALTRLGGSDVEVEEILGAADPLDHRNKSQYPVSAGKVGFYRARTHDVVDIEHCLIQKPQADAAAAALRDYMRDFAVRPTTKDGARPAAPPLCPHEPPGREPCLRARTTASVYRMRRSWSGGCAAPYRTASAWCSASIRAAATRSSASGTARSGARTRSKTSSAA